MRRLIELALILVVAAGGLLTVSVPSQASPIECEEYDLITGRCVIFLQPPPPDYPVPPGEGPGDPGEPGEPVCVDHLTENEMPCVVGTWYWSYDWACYTKIELNPDPNDPAWGGRTEGALYWCSRGVTLTDPFPPDSVLRWSPSPPWGSPPDPEELARAAVETMNLRAINVGIVPEPVPGRVGIIGLPTYMWVESPTASTWGPITRTATSGPWSVTATAHVDWIDWDMGDGTIVTCTTVGTPYADAYQDQPSPDCGHTYTEDGDYTVTATSYWVIEWSGLGQSGTINMDFADSAAITMGEVQVIVQ